MAVDVRKQIIIHCDRCGNEEIREVEDVSAFTFQDDSKWGQVRAWGMGSITDYELCNECVQLVRVFISGTPTDNPELVANAEK